MNHRLAAQQLNRILTGQVTTGELCNLSHCQEGELYEALKYTISLLSRVSICRTKHIVEPPDIPMSYVDERLTNDIAKFLNVTNAIKFDTEDDYYKHRIAELMVVVPKETNDEFR